MPTIGYARKSVRQRKHAAERAPNATEMVELRKTSGNNDSEGTAKKQKRKRAEVGRRGELPKRRLWSKILRNSNRKPKRSPEYHPNSQSPLSDRQRRQNAIVKFHEQYRRFEIRHKQLLLRDIVAFEKRRLKATQNRSLCCRICCCWCLLCCCRRRMDEESVSQRLHSLRVAEYRRRLIRKDQRRVGLKKLYRRYRWDRRQPMTFQQKRQHYRKALHHLLNYGRIRRTKSLKVKFPLRRLTPYSPPPQLRRIAQPGKRPKRKRKVGEWRAVAYLKNTRNECIRIYRQWRKTIRDEEADKAAAARGNRMISRDQYLQLKRSFIRSQMQIPSFGTKASKPTAKEEKIGTGKQLVVAEIHNEEFKEYEETPIRRTKSEQKFNDAFSQLCAQKLSESSDLREIISNTKFHDVAVSSTREALKANSNIFYSAISSLCSSSTNDFHELTEISTSSHLREKIRAALSGSNPNEPCSSATAFARDAQYNEAMAIMQREVDANRDPFMLRRRFHLKVETLHSDGIPLKCENLASDDNALSQHQKYPYPVDYHHEERYLIPSPNFTPKSHRHHLKNLRHYSEKNPHFLKLPKFYDDPLSGRPLPYRRIIPPPLPPPYLDPYRYNRPPLQGCQSPPVIPWQKDWRGNYVQLSVAQISQSNVEREKALKNSKDFVENRHYSAFTAQREEQWHPENRGNVSVLRYFLDSVRRQWSALKANRKPRMPTQAEKEFVLGTRLHYPLANLEGFRFVET